MKNMLSTLAFYAKYNNSWQSFSKYDRATKRAIWSLQKRGFLEVNQFSQARFTGKTFAS